MDMIVTTRGQRRENCKDFKDIDFKETVRRDKVYRPNSNTIIISKRRLPKATNPCCCTAVVDQADISFNFAIENLRKKKTIQNIVFCTNKEAES